MTKRPVFILLLLTLLSFEAVKETAASTAVKKGLQERIQEAFDYLQVKPAVSLEIIQAAESELANADSQLQFEAWHTGLWAGSYLADQNVLQTYSQRIISTFNATSSRQQQSRILRAISARLWHLGDYQTAFHFSLCSLQKAQDLQRIYSSILSMGLNKRISDPEKSKQLYMLALNRAQKSRHNPYEAALNNNLGVVALQLNQFEKAEQYFHKALTIRSAQNHISGQLHSGLNLMLIYLFQKDWLSFERLSARMARLLKVHPNELLAAYYHWMSWAFNQRHYSQYSAQQQSENKRLVESIDNDSLKMSVVKAAHSLGFTLTYRPPDKNTDHRELMQTFEFCEWQKIESLSFEETLILVKQKLTPFSDAEAANPH